MSTNQLSGVIHQLRAAMLRRDAAGLTDGQLLEDFVSRRDEAALASLVRRHGPMVWGICLRVLGNYADAEDAFQATFLVLLRKAASIVPREMVANWLYGVGRQTALKARATAARRRGLEKQVAEMPETAVDEPGLWLDIQPLLDEELGRLPGRYRSVIVLCDLEGKTRKDAARQLGVPDGTVAGWLARARVMLAKRLARRGMVISGGSLATMLAQNAASAGVSAAVASSTLKAASLVAAGQAATAGLISVKAAALTKGVLKSMLMTKLKIAFGIALAAVVAGAGVSANGLLRQSRAAQPTTTPIENKKEREVTTASAPDVNENPALPASDSKRIVAHVFGDVPITREEFADYLIALYGEERLPLYVNKRIIEMVATRQKIEITRQEIDAAIDEDCKRINISKTDFDNRILKERYKKTPDEWRNDVIKPRLMLAKMCRSRITVDEIELKQMFENRYGEKAKCKVIVWPKDQLIIAKQMYVELRKPGTAANPDASWDAVAVKQADATLAARAGEIEPIGRYSGPETSKIVDIALTLKVGEVSAITETPMGFVVVKRIGTVEPVKGVEFENVKPELYVEVMERKLAKEVPAFFAKLKKEANPVLLLPVDKRSTIPEHAPEMP